ncbi:SDR family NAD(P)-dependent oxidoreductase [Marmoricola sp. RAF53]|uniref:SDR family NAD(P)-dependent oxidoreductase n=1 Tax=Marmoricola sp. RAF53 TaxID=3233059 RepID=UPI003F96D8E8
MTGTEAPVLDRLLDRSIVGGYTNIGYALRRGHWPADPAEGALAGRRALVTGAGSGLGEATALGLARLGATVHLLGRDPDRVRPAMARITDRLRQEGREAVLHAEGCDVADLAQVHRFATAFAARLAENGDALDVVVHNAGVLPSTRTTSPDGHELSLATHVLGPVLMTDLLAPALRRSATGARVILVSSGGMYTQPLPLADPEYRQGSYRGAVAYARSKRVQVEIVPHLAHHLEAENVSVHVMHPGWADTPGVAASLPAFRLLTRPFLRTSAQGADTIVWLAAAQPPPPGGLLWHDRRPRPFSYTTATTATEADRDEIWSWVRAAVAGTPAA